MRKRSRISIPQLNRFALAAFLAFALAGHGALADPARISELLGNTRLFGILQREGEAYGDDLAREMLQGGASTGWRAEVAAIHAPERLLPEYRRVFDAALAASDQAAIERWLAADLGRRMVALELSAREAMLDPGKEEAAIAAAEAADAKGDKRLAAVRRLIAASDLIETNVAGGLNANLTFYRAMNEGGAFPYAVSEAEMLADVAADEESIREEVTAWIEGYLYTAYAPLSMSELEACADFAASPPGKALLAAQFAGFDVVYERTSHDLGAALARQLTSSEL